ncbi:MAG TPA: cytidylate kinase-like family protein [Tepidisphaeraceae bacterium]|jgi:hypothetical protein
MATHYIPKTIRTANMPMSEPAVIPGRRPAAAVPFVTIAQQAGAESADLPRRLAERLTARDGGGDGGTWLSWDEELIDKVSADSHIPADVIQSLETSGHSWLDDLLGGIAGRTDEVTVFHRVSETVRRLAETGRAILVGHGSNYLTRGLPGGLHIRLYAPQDVRVEHVARRFDLTPPAALKHMRQLDRERAAFFSRFFPGQPLVPELFSAELNTAALDEQQVVEAILAMMPYAR